MELVVDNSKSHFGNPEGNPVVHILKKTPFFPGKPCRLRRNQSVKCTIVDLVYTIDSHKTPPGVYLAFIPALERVAYLISNHRLALGDEIFALFGFCERGIIYLSTY